jgi:hypothetical protein
MITAAASLYLSSLQTRLPLAQRLVGLMNATVENNIAMLLLLKQDRI